MSITACSEAELLRILETAVEAVKESRQVIQETGTRKVAEQFYRDVKLDLDYRLHEYIGNRLRAESPYAVWSEEDGVSRKRLPGNQYSWVVDPLDGSVNFSRGIPFHCISVALCWGTDPKLGVVYDFGRNELFSGSVGTGLWLNGRPVGVSTVAKKEDAILCTGFPVATDFSTTAVTRFVEDVQDYKKVRLLGAAALSLAYVAAGRADVYREKDIAFWDVAAGLALVKAGGGRSRVETTGVEERFDVTASNLFL